MILSSTQKLQVVLAGAITTSQLPVIAGWAGMLDDASTLAPGSITTATNSTTAVDVVAAPAAGNKRQVKYLSVYNADTVAATLTVRLDDAATVRILCKVALPVGWRLEYTGEGFRVLNLDGAVYGQGANGTNGTNGQGVPVAGTTGQVLTKNSNTDYDTVWSTSSGGGSAPDFLLQAQGII